MLRLINYLILVSSIIITLLILLQSKGGGLSNVFGGEGNAYQTRRGLEKGLFATTIILSVVFVGLVVASLFIQK
jgi:protein translocase SecG subunit